MISLTSALCNNITPRNKTVVGNSDAKNFQFGDYSPEEFGAPSVVQGRKVWGRKSPKAETNCRHCLQILTAETIRI